MDTSLFVALVFVVARPLALVVDVSDMGWLAFLAHVGLLGLASILAPLAGIYAVCRSAFELDHEVSALVGIGLSTTSAALPMVLLRDLPSEISG